MSGCRNVFLVISLFSLSRKSETPTKSTRYLKQEVRADFTKTKSLQNEPTLSTSMQGRKPSASIPSVKTTYEQPQSLINCTKDQLEILCILIGESPQKRPSVLLGEDRQTLRQNTQSTIEISQYEALYQAIEQSCL